MLTQPMKSDDDDDTLRLDQLGPQAKDNIVFNFNRRMQCLHANVASVYHLDNMDNIDNHGQQSAQATNRLHSCHSNNSKSLQY